MVDPSVASEMSQAMADVLTLAVVLLGVGYLAWFAYVVYRVYVS